MLPVFLGCPVLFSLRYSLTFICPVSCVHYVVSFFGVSFFLSSLRYSLAFICPLSCVLYVASFSRLSFVFSLRYSLTFICPVSCVPYVASFSGFSLLLPLRYSLEFIYKHHLPNFELKCMHINYYYDLYNLLLSCVTFKKYNSVRQ